MANNASDEQTVNIGQPRHEDLKLSRPGVLWVNPVFENHGQLDLFTRFRTGSSKMLQLLHKRLYKLEETCFCKNHHIVIDFSLKISPKTKKSVEFILFDPLLGVEATPSDGG